MPVAVPGRHEAGVQEGRLGPSPAVALPRARPRTMAETPLAETRSLDDQIEWLDDDNVLYQVDEQVWRCRPTAAARRGCTCRRPRRLRSSGRQPDQVHLPRQPHRLPLDDPGPESQNFAARSSALEPPSPKTPLSTSSVPPPTAYSRTAARRVRPSARRNARRAAHAAAAGGPQHGRVDWRHASRQASLRVVHVQPQRQDGLELRQPDPKSWGSMRR